MASKPSTKAKPVADAARAKINSNGKNEQMVLIRDETSQVLIVTEAGKVSSVKKGAKLVPGIIVTWQDNARERWRGPVLAMGSEAQCSKAMATIDKNSESSETGTTQSTNKEKYKTQSTITIVPKAPEEVQMDEEEDDVIEQSLHMVEDDEKEPISSVSETTDTSTMSTGVRVEKRPAEETTDGANRRKKYSKHAVTVPFSVYAAKEKECMSFQAQVAMYEQQWMPRPKDPKVVQYLIEVTNILCGRTDEEEEEEDMETVFETLLTNLGTTEKQLQSCHRKTATATARQIMKIKYPNPSEDFKFSEVPEEVIQSTIRYSRIANPTDQSLDVDIKHAMGNYVATHLHKIKPKENMPAARVLTEAKKNNEI